MRKTRNLNRDFKLSYYFIWIPTSNNDDKFSRQWHLPMNHFWPLPGQTFIGFWEGFSPSHPYFRSAKDDPTCKCLGLNDVFQLMDIDCYALTCIASWPTDAVSSWDRGLNSVHHMSDRFPFLNFSSLDLVITPSNLRKKPIPIWDLFTAGTLIKSLTIKRK